MTISHVSSIELCPIHFEKFDALNRKIGSIEETLLLSKIMFHLQGSKITKHGVKCIVRSREHIAKWFGFSLRKTDTLLSKLVSKGFLIRTNGLWHGVKRLFLSVQHVDEFVPVNMTLLDVLVDVTGSIDAAIAYARIAFIHVRASTSTNTLSWIFLRKNALAQYLGVSIRKLDTLVGILIRKGLLLKKNMIACGRRQTHFHIPLSSLKVLKARYLDKIALSQVTESTADNKGNTPEDTSCKNCRLEPAKFATSIKVRTFTKKANNSTRNGFDHRVGQSVDDAIGCDINFSKRDLAYLQGALANLIHRDGIRVSNPKELLAQMKYALTQQISKFNLSFNHGVNRLCAIVRSGNWSTPYGFYSYSLEGRALKADSEAQEKQWQQQKQEECSGGSMTQLEAMAATDNKTDSQDAYSGSVDNMNQEIGLIGTVTGKLQRCRQHQGGGALMGKLVSTLNLSARECPSVLTQKAIALAQQLKCLNTKIKQLTIKGSRDEQHILLSLADKLLARIKDLLTQGANAVSVQAVLAES